MDWKYHITSALWINLLENVTLPPRDSTRREGTVDCSKLSQGVRDECHRRFQLNQNITALHVILVKLSTSVYLRCEINSVRAQTALTSSHGNQFYKSPEIIT